MRMASSRAPSLGARNARWRELANGVQKIRPARRIAALGTTALSRRNPIRRTASAKALRTVVLIFGSNLPMTMAPRRSGGGGVGTDQTFERTQAAGLGRVVAEQTGVVMHDQCQAVDFEGHLLRVGFGLQFAGFDGQLDGARQCVAPTHFELQQPVTDRAGPVVELADGRQVQATAVIGVANPVEPALDDRP